jgi:murein tripeptide amidase MpaA
LDGETWISLPDACYREEADRKEAVLTLESGPQKLWVAAQELVSVERITNWAGALDRLPFVQGSEVGRTVSGARLIRLDVGSRETARKVVILGRQHPPETTGSLALMRFVEELVADTPEARAFREAYHVVVFPLLNPDGVNAGHWRHNLGRVDLNRDWQHFKQAETRSVRDEVAQLTAPPARLRLWLDFHSTFKDVFYTQTAEQITSPAAFTDRWLEALQVAVPDYVAKREASPVPTPTTSTFWAHQQFGCPAITYEIGDHTDRALLRQVAAAASREMMRLLLELRDAP